MKIIFENYILKKTLAENACRNEPILIQSFLHYNHFLSNSQALDTI
jgi:hypothetical protein